MKFSYAQALTIVTRQFESSRMDIHPEYNELLNWMGHKPGSLADPNYIDDTLEREGSTLEEILNVFRFQWVGAVIPTESGEPIGVPEDWMKLWDNDPLCNKYINDYIDMHCPPGTPLIGDGSFGVDLTGAIGAYLSLYCSSQPQRKGS